jgi:hypothetical protein
VVEEASRLGTSYRIALGIGLHNLGEGLAIGTTFALGTAALGVFLVVGFTLHSITEGVGIAAPILKERPRLVHFLWLALVGGGPAIVGIWIGGFAFSNLLAAVFLAVGAGAILQVIYEVTRLLLREGFGPVKEPGPLCSELGRVRLRGGHYVRDGLAGERVDRECSSQRRRSQLAQAGGETTAAVERYEVGVFEVEC